MTSKYDPYWVARLDEIRTAVEIAASGVPATVDVHQLCRLGARQSWYGTVEIRGRAATQASMAHTISLGRIVASSGACMLWPELTFRFTINQACILTIATRSRADLAQGDLLGAPPLASQSAAAAEARGAAVVIEDGGHLDPATACARIHAALAALPPWSHPASVPFNNGLYFFYEQGEYSPHGLDGRIVRIGNHPRAQDRLVGRLEDHFNSRPGAKNFSVFRRYLGGALLRRSDANSPCLQPAPGQGHWEKQDDRPCPSCEGMESAVGAVLSSAFTFRCIRVEDRPERNNFEKWLIATVAACPVCRSSTDWLGRNAHPYHVRNNGLWNVQYIGRQTATEQQLRRFEELIDMTLQATGSGSQLDLSHTLLVIPCSGGKDGVADPGLPSTFIGDLVGTAERELLEQGRRLAFMRPGATLEPSSLLRHALAYYTGQPYATEGVREALVRAISRGLHCLIVSAGYGVLRAEEPIHRYNAQMTRTQLVWAPRLPVILADYVRRQRIDRSYVLLSQQYAACVPQLTSTERRSVPRFTRGLDQGAPIRVIPSRIGAELSKLLPKLMSGITATGQG
jgi:hypothetical protein